MAGVVSLGLKAVESFIKGELLGGRSARSIERALKASGVQFTTKTFFDLAREIRSAIDFRPIVRSLDPNKLVQESLHVITNRRIPTQYQYIINVQYQDPFTGEIKNERLSVFSSKRLSPQTVLSDARGRLIGSFGANVTSTIPDVNINSIELDLAVVRSRARS